MALKKFKPVTPSLRFKQLTTREELTKVDGPYKPLTEGLRKKAGRNNTGRITVRRRGGGHKRLYRIIDFKRTATGAAVVESIEYDPNRTANIALIKYEDGKRAYIVAPLGLKVGDKLQNGENAEINVGNTLPLSKIPVGTVIHNIELKPGHGAQLVRAAGAYAELMAKEGKLCRVRLPSGEVRMVSSACTAAIGTVGNIDHMNVSSGKAGRTRWLGRRPKVRGVVMNPVDHPMGGGEGRTSGGSHPVSPWGKLAKGGKTRNNKRTDKFIVSHRPSKRKK